MKITKLVAFGCSYTYGDELINPAIKSANSNAHGCDTENTKYRLDHCFAGLVANHFGLELDNMAFPGGSLESMRWNLMWYLKSGAPKDVIFLVGLTEATRISWYNPDYSTSITNPSWNRHVHGTWLKQPNPDVDPNWYTLQKTWLAMSYHRDWAEFNFSQTINLFDQSQSRYGIPVIQFNVLNNNYAPTCPSLFYPRTNFKEILLAKQKEFGENYFAPGGHPNEQGHQIIADHLIEHIKYSKILEC